MAPGVSWLLFLLALLLTTAKPVPVVQAPWGSLQGVSVDGDGGRKIDAYLGIPYAVPPVEELRFEKPLPHTGLGDEEVFVADTITPACPQDQPALIGSVQTISEDCLTLNVYVPASSPTDSPRCPAAQSYAVMVFLHGGAFTMGDAASYRPSRLVADEEVIVVTMQYRLGPLGFISSGDDALPGNLGLWDQNLAIRWVKVNIGAFGGDPDAITVFGGSAGSYGAGLQMLSPQSRGLFKRVIMQSGSPLTVKGFLSMTNPKENFRLIAEQFCCEGRTNVDRVQCLKQVPLEEYLNKTLELVRKSPLGGLFYPVVDGEFLPGYPEDLVQNEQYMEENGVGDVDVLAGFNSREGSLLFFQLAHAQLPPEALTTAPFFQAIVDACVKFNQGSPVSNDAAKKVVDDFYRGADAGTDTAIPVDTLTDLYKDCIMSTPTIHWLSHLAAASPRRDASRYLYVLDHEFAFNRHGLMPGAHHADDLLLQFDSEPLLPPDSLLPVMLHKTALAVEEEPLAAMFVKICATFAKTGNPSPAVQNILGEGGWPQFTVANESYLSLSLAPHVHNDSGPYRDSRTLWHRLLPQLTALTSQAADSQESQHPRESSEGRNEEL